MMMSNSTEREVYAAVREIFEKRNGTLRLTPSQLSLLVSLKAELGLIDDKEEWEKIDRILEGRITDESTLPNKNGISIQEEFDDVIIVASNGPLEDSFKDYPKKIHDGFVQLTKDVKSKQPETSVKKESSFSGGPSAGISKVASSDHKKENLRGKKKNSDRRQSGSGLQRKRLSSEIQSIETGCQIESKLVNHLLKSLPISVKYKRCADGKQELSLNVHTNHTRSQREKSVRPSRKEAPAKKIVKKRKCSEEDCNTDHDANENVDLGSGDKGDGQIRTLRPQTRNNIPYLYYESEDSDDIGGPLTLRSRKEK
eukprot:CAMPEP_0114998430 /NCGR_PEP_ID=MMETSP0216-20121206/15504_1 /TAXON_ID=223996 /ORGANISM="Protocruzia adherens, Strain Boccale" /LENGTH=311 /DNA_ID=CAMNT_0002363029 /DNA_START=961 /DNA_END=1896 /DNA_ORIENTATION=+